MKDTISNNKNYTKNNNNTDNNGRTLSPFMFVVFVLIVAFQWILPIDDFIKIITNANNEESSIVYEIETEETETTTEFCEE